MTSDTRTATVPALRLWNLLRISSYRQQLGVTVFAPNGALPSLDFDAASVEIWHGDRRVWSIADTLLGIEAWVDHQFPAGSVVWLDDDNLLEVREIATAPANIG